MEDAINAILCAMAGEWTKKAIAKKIGISENTLRTYLNGYANMPAWVLIGLCDTLGLSVDEISRNETKLGYAQALTAAKRSKHWTMDQRMAVVMEIMKNA